MGRTIDRLYGSPFTIFLILSGIGILLGLSMFSLGISIISSLLLFIAFVEAGLLLAGLVEFQRRLQGTEKTRE